MAEELSPIEKAYDVVVAGVKIAGETTQKPGRDEGLPDKLLQPPLPLEALAKLSQINSTRGACIEALAINVVGLGVDAVPRDAKQPPEDHLEKAQELLELLDALAGRDIRMDRPSFVELLSAVKTDEEECGQGFLEVSRNRITGEIDGLFKLPGAKMRRLAKRDGWMLPGSGGWESGITFSDFREKVAYNDDGTIKRDESGQAELAPGGSWDRNEVIVFRLHSSESRDYGLPRDAALALEYAADKLAAESNVAFFDSSGVPPTIIFVMGEEDRDGTGRLVFKVPQDTVNRIASAVKSDTGHKDTVAIVPLPAGAKVQKEALAQRSDRDIGNTVFRASIDRRVLARFRLQPIFVPAIEDTGRYTAEVQRAITLEQVFDPEQARYVASLDPLVRELGYGDLRIAFKRLAVESDQAKRDSADALALTGAITNRELRRAHGMGPLPEHDTETDPEKAALDGKVPKGWNDRLATSPKLAGGAAQTPFGGAAQGSPFPRPDQRGLRPGIGGRSRQVPGENGQRQQGPAAVAKGEHVDHVDAAASELETVFLDITDDAITEGMRRTFTVAEVVAGRVADIVNERNAPESAPAGA